jgi:predicted aconitase
MSETPPRIERHEAADRFGRISMRTAHDLGAALTESGSADGEPIVVRRGGPHRSLDGLAALIDAALADEKRPDAPPPA